MRINEEELFIVVLLSCGPPPPRHDATLLATLTYYDEILAAFRDLGVSDAYLTFEAVIRFIDWTEKQKIG